MVILSRIKLSLKLNEKYEYTKNNDHGERNCAAYHLNDNSSVWKSVLHTHNYTRVYFISVHISAKIEFKLEQSINTEIIRIVGNHSTIV